jgi:hypothetical protein
MLDLEGEIRMKNYRIISFYLVILAGALILGYLKWPVHALSGNDRLRPDDLVPVDPPDDFFAGHYVMVGQKPSDGRAYKGRARIEIKENKIVLYRTLTGKTTSVEGEFYPGGESKKKSLKFKWKNAQGSAEMICQYSVDFDNYARLSCVWTDGSKSHEGVPGFESYYPLAPYTN